MLKVRLIPCLDVRHGKVTKGIKFQNNVDLGDPSEFAKQYYDDGADELVIYDISASPEGRGPDEVTIEKICSQVFIPVCVGGGISTLEHATSCIRSGAEKISINSYAYKNPNLLTEISKVFGVQAVVLGIDTSADSTSQSGYRCFANGGRVATEWDLLDWIKFVVPFGVGEICINSIDADGTKQGYDILLMKKVQKECRVPLIWSGGVGTIEHLIQGAKSGANALLMASILHENTSSIGKIKTEFKQSGIPVR